MVSRSPGQGHDLYCLPLGALCLRQVLCHAQVLALGDKRGAALIPELRADPLPTLHPGDQEDPLVAGSHSSQRGPQHLGQLQASGQSLLPGPQRWNPVGGFCEKFLPSDRWQWSDVSGLQHRPLDGVALPSRHWEWESDWYVDENFGGEPTEKGVGEFGSAWGSPLGKECFGLDPYPRGHPQRPSI